MAEQSQLLAAVETPHARLIGALASSIETQGYRDTTVADIVRIAKTSRRTFYEHFADRAECFLALFEQVTQRRMAEIAAAVDPDAPLELQIERAIDAFLEGESMDPELHRSFVRELPGLSEAGAEVVRVTNERFAALLVGLTAAAADRHPEAHLQSLSHDVAIIVIGGLRELVVNAIQDRRDLREIRGSAIQVIKAILASLQDA
jgi:AcrR family transcriptional regulator